MTKSWIHVILIIKVHLKSQTWYIATMFGWTLKLRVFLFARIKAGFKMLNLPSCSTEKWSIQKEMRFSNQTKPSCSSQKHFWFINAQLNTLMTKQTHQVCWTRWNFRCSIKSEQNVQSVQKLFPIFLKSLRVFNPSITPHLQPPESNWTHFVRRRQPLYRFHPGSRHRQRLHRNRLQLQLVLWH